MEVAITLCEIPASVRGVYRKKSKSELSKRFVCDRGRGSVIIYVWQTCREDPRSIPRPSSLACAVSSRVRGRDSERTRKSF